MGLELVEKLTSRAWFEKLDIERKAEVLDWENKGWVLSRDQKDNTFQADKMFDGDFEFTVLKDVESLNVLLYRISQVETERAQAGKTNDSVPIVEVKPEKKCTECGEPGATKYSGKCLKCISAKFRAEYERAYLGDKRFLIPSDPQFEMGDFLPAPELEKIGNDLIRKYKDDFDHIKAAKILYRWRRKGGSSTCGDVLGKCIKPTGLIKHFAETHSDDWDESVDYIVWLAADHLRNRMVNERVVHAVIFHELLHTVRIQGNFVLRGHEFEGFAREIEEFGFWKQTIRNIAEAVDSVKYKQYGLFDEE